MSGVLNAPAILNREFLEIRAKILEIAASYDRLDRAEGNVADDPRMNLLEQGLLILAEDRPGRAERVQILFSRGYDADWREKKGVKTGPNAKN